VISGKPSYTFEDKIGFVSCSLRLVLSHTDILHQPDERLKREEKIT